MNWTEIEAIGTWVAALGTIAAVGTALYLSLYQTKQRLNIDAGGDGHYYVSSGNLTIINDYGIVITNIGFRPVVIQGLKWIMTNYPRKGRLVIDEYRLIDENHQPPYRLIEGESLKIALGKERLRSIIGSFSFIHDVNIEPDFLKGLKLSVVTPTESIEVAVGQDMIEALMEVAKRYPNV
jgi:hypothetical protein